MFLQNKQWLKWLELIGIGILLLVVTMLFPVSEVILFFLYSLFVLLVSVRYGILLGLAAVGWTVIQTIVLQWRMGNDVYLYINFGNFWISTLYLAIVAYTAGLYATRYRERYEDKEAERRELELQLTQAVATLQTVHETNSILEKKVLTSESTMANVYQMLRVLDQEDVEKFTDRVAEILEEYYGVRTYGVYHVDQNGLALRVKLRRGSASDIPQTIFTDAAPSFFQRMFTSGNITMRAISEEEATAPFLAIPLKNGEKVQQVIVIADLDIGSLSRDGLVLLQHVQDIFGDYLARASERQREARATQYFADTTICKPTYFKKRVEIEKERWDKFDISYSYFTLPITITNEDGVRTIDAAIRPYIREVDIIGFFPKKSCLVVLLPATSEEHLRLVKDRIQVAAEGLIVSHE